MKKQSFIHGCQKVFLVLISLSFVLAGPAGYGNPQGMTVVSGSASSAQHGNTLQITTSQTAVLQWSSFNIAAGQTTIFNQPSATSIVFNNIKNANPSTIFGSLEANGIVVLENSSGFYFGPNAFVKAGGLVVTTSAINPWSSAGGAGWSFDGPPPVAPIVNYGHLETASGGSLFLIGKQIENQGTIETPGGTAALIAGQQVLLSERPDGLSLSAPVQLPAGSVDNQGRIIADAGQVLLQAQTVNNSGSIQANSVRQQNGVIELYASQDIQLTGSSVIQANGDGEGISQGGNIVIKSGGTFSDSAGSQITATGGANGGNGGNVEVSAPSILSLNSKIDAGAQAGWSEGLFSLDPENIVLGTFSSGSTSAGTSGIINATGSSGTVDVDVGSAFQNITASILLEASGNITLNSGTTWNLSASTGKTSGQVTLEAGGSITLDNDSLITDANNWSLTLDAGFNFAAGHGVIAGTGGAANNVTLEDGASIQTAGGAINILAGNNVTVGSGGIVTVGGGNINVQAVAGTVNCGSSQAGYVFTDKGYTVDPNLGGISTANGGNVSIQAGGNIVGIITSGSVGEDSGSGAFGAAPGNVTLTAGGNVTGDYVLANGAGNITAANVGTPNNNLALSLIKGEWVVNATENIVLQEVRNPNGMFNSGTEDNPFEFLFNYDPAASVVLDAGNGVVITGNGLPRSTVNPLEGLIFPPILTIEAGAGGITLDTSLSLFPSPVGSLAMSTTGGGDLSSSSPGTAVTVCISDSQNVQWLHALDFTPSDPTGNSLLHLNDPNPVLIDISGSVSDFNLDSPKPVEMFVAQNLIDSSASIANLHPTDTSILSVGGQILDYADYVIVTLPSGQAPNFAALDAISAPFVNILTSLPDLTPNVNPNLAVPNPNLNPTLQNQQNLFKYDPTSGGLEYQGVMSLGVEQALLAMKTPFASAAAIEQIYAQSQNEPGYGIPGYNVAGPGTFRINAGSIDLGNGGGIISAGISDPAQAAYTPRGADLDISVSGNLSMLASTIESMYGGNINITCGGTIDVGSLLIPSSSDKSPLGIVSLWGGNISVIAEGDVNVDGSRIAAYDGGDIFVESLAGNVNAGTGGDGEVLVTKPYLDAKGQVEYLDEVIPGSGILATSFPQLVYGQTSGQIGSITVESPEGNIVASQGGIEQLVLGPVAHNDSTINLVAGSYNSDGGVAFVGDVDASGSGVVGGQVNISATGNINGLVVASLGANVNALQNVSATVLSQGGAIVSAGGTVSGTIVGVGSVSVSGATDVAAAFGGGGVSTSGTVAGAAVAAAPSASNSGAAAATTQQVTQSTQANTDLASNDTGDENEKKKKKAQLMEYVGRVTVILPP
jgi:filamentous hemagglutinin family protein